MTQSAYIHIPFCLNKCNYCSFVSYDCFQKSDIENYVQILLKEIDYYYKNEHLKTLYLGGGTPSLLDTDSLKKIIDKFYFENNAEITIEVNPETVDFDYLSKLKKLGFNRVSIGVQTFNDNILKIIGRVHDSKTAIDTVDSAQKVGFENISTDFIYGLPNQTLNDFLKDLETAVKTGVEHISLYGLKIEENCKFYKSLPKNLPNDDCQADMYLAAIDFLQSKGYKHYEISNFCKDGKFSRHNLNYWKCGEYYGFGVSAHGYTDGCRYANFSDLKKYIQNFFEKESMHMMDKKEKLEETIFLGLRCCEGINIQQINKTFDIDFEKAYKNVLEKYLNTGHIIKTDSGYAFSKKGFLLSNIILADFL